MRKLDGVPYHKKQEINWLMRKLVYHLDGIALNLSLILPNPKVEEEEEQEKEDKVAATFTQ